MCSDATDNQDDREEQPQRHGFSTRAISDGDPPDEQTGAVIPPIYHATTYEMDGPGEPKAGYDYIRTGNPTRQALEEKLASLENAEHGLFYASGMSAIHCALTTLDAGDEVVAEENVYGGTHRILTSLFDKYNVSVKWIDATDPDQLREAVTDDTDVLWLETPTNPLLKVLDLELCAEVADRHFVRSIVDNTLASPYLQNPLDHGIDAVVHSATKYIGGHTDALGGAIVTDEQDIYEEMKFFQNAIGAVPGTLENVTFLKGAKTLSLRMEQACENAMILAEFLQDHDRVREVKYPGLSSHPQHDLAERQMKRPGALLSFVVDEDVEQNIRTFFEALELFPLAVSLGAVESLINHPWTMTHAPVPEDEKRAQGITPGLVRISVGVEDVDDLVQDLDHAFQLAS
jgi:cystathionine beta-lyase/cystathionine gamma-synthase